MKSKKNKKSKKKTGVKFFKWLGVAALVGVVSLGYFWWSNTSQNKGEEVEIAQMMPEGTGGSELPWKTVTFNQAGQVAIYYWKLKYPSINAYSGAYVKASWWLEGKKVWFFLKGSYEGYPLRGSYAWIGDKLESVVGNWNSNNTFFWPRGVKPVTTNNGRRWCNRVDVTDRLLSITNQGRKIAAAQCWEAGAGWFLPLPNVVDYSDFLLVFSAKI